MLVVQLVEILWTKATRGAPCSNERVRLPRAFPVPGGTAEYVFHHVRLAEQEAFAPTMITLESATAVPRTQGVLSLSPGPGERKAEAAVNCKGPPTIVGGICVSHC